LDELDVSGQEVNLQVNTIVSTNTLQMRKVSGLQIQDVDGEHSPVKISYVYAQDNIPATHHNIATPDIARQWEHLKVIADKIYHHPQIGIGMLIGRNVPTAFQPLEVIYRGADEPWAEKYKFGWTIIGPVCLDKIVLHESTAEASVNRVTIMSQKLPIHNSGNGLGSHPNHQTDIVTHFVDTSQMKDMTSPQQIREMMQLDFSELNYSRKTLGTELTQLIKDRRFCQIISTDIHKMKLTFLTTERYVRRDCCP